MVSRFAIGFVLVALTFFAQPLQAAVKFKDNAIINLTAEVGKAFDVPLRDLLEDEGTGNLEWSKIGNIPNPLNQWMTLDLAGERMFGTPGTSVVGSTTFSLTVKDTVTGEGGGIARVTVKVIHAPIWNGPIDLGKIPEKTNFNFDLKSKVSFAGAGALTFSVEDPTKMPPWLGLNPNGILSGRPERVDLGVFDGIVFIATSPEGASAKVNARGEVVKVINWPRWTGNPITLENAKEDFAYSKDVSGPLYVTPGEANATITFNLKGTPPAWLDMSAAGVLSGKPGAGDVTTQPLQLEAELTASVDGQTHTETTILTFSVLHTNHPPVWTENPIRFSVEEEKPMSRSIADKAKDSDPGDVLVFFKTGGPSWATLTSDGTFSGTPQIEHEGDNKFTVRVDDRNGGIADVEVIITVLHVNHAPFWTQQPVVLPNAPERSPYSASVASFADDIDDELIPNETRTFSKISGPAWAKLSSDGTLTGTPQRPDVGMNIFTVRVTDAAGAKADVEVRVTVERVNLPPYWTQASLMLPDAVEDGAYSYDVAPFAKDDDQNPSDILSFEKVSGPDWLIVNSDGTLGGKPAESDITPSYTAVIRVSDGKAHADINATGKVKEKNHAPTINQANLFFTIKERANFQVNLNDPQYVSDKNNDTLVFSVLNGASWFHISSNGETFANPLHQHLGEHTFRFRVSDGVLSTDADIHITVERDPQTPIWKQDPIVFQATARTPFAKEVASKAEDPDGWPLTFAKKSGDAWLTVNPDGSISGTPGDANVGDNTFVVTASNDGKSADVTVIVRVAAKNHPPTIHQDNLTFTIKERENFTVSLNDPKYVEDTENNPLVFNLVDSAPWMGLASNGDLMASPLHPQIGSHSFRFTVSDGEDTASGTLTLVVVRDPQPPQWLQDPIEFTATARKLFRGAVGSKAIDLDGMPLTFSKKNGPAWLTIDSQGNLRGTPQDEHIGKNTFTVTARNDGLGTDVTVIITVSQGNQDPFWTQNPVVLPVAITDKPYNQNVASFAGDPDNDPLTFSKVNGPDWLNVATSGQVIGTPSLGDLGLNEFTVRVQDPDGAFADVKVHITVEKPNTPPVCTDTVIALKDAFTEKQYSFSIANKATDADGDVLTWRKIQGPGWMVTGSDGKLSGIPKTADIQKYTAIFEVTDGKDPIQCAASGEVFRKNDPPTINQANLSFTMKEREVLNISLNDPNFVSDPDGDPLTFTLIDTASWVTLSSGGDLQLKPLHPQVGEHQFKFKVSDGKLEAEGTLFVKVLRDPRPPEWTQNPIRIDTVVNVPINATLADYAVDPDGLPLRFSKINGPSWLTVNADGKLVGTPGNPDLGENPFTVRVANDVLHADAQLIVNVVIKNDPPYWTQDPIPLKDAAPDQTYAESVASFAKDPEGERLTFEKIAGPGWAFITTSGLIIGTPTQGDGGLNTLTVRVLDPHKAYADATVQILVNVGGANTPPRWTQIPLDFGRIPVDTAYTFDLKNYVEDVDGDALTFKKISGPDWMLVSSSGVITGVPRDKDLGQFTAEFEVTDSKSLPVPNSGKGEVVNGGGNKDPQFKPEALSFIVKENTELKVNINDPKYVSDPDGDPLTFELLNPPTWITLSPNGELVIRPLHQHLGDHNFQVRASDNKGGSAVGPMFVRVVPGDVEPPLWLQDPIRFTTKVNVPFAKDISNFAQDPQGLALTFSKTSGPFWLTIGTNGQISGTPGTPQLGDNVFGVSVTNGSQSANASLIITVVKDEGPVVDEKQIDIAHAGAESENLWIVDNSWPWLGHNWLMKQLKKHIHTYYEMLNDANIHHRAIYLSSDVQSFREPIRGRTGSRLFGWQDSDATGEFIYRMDRTKKNTCYSSPIWSMFNFYEMVPGMSDIYHNGYHTAGVPMDAMIITTHKDSYRHYSQGTPQSGWNARDFVNDFKSFHGDEKQSYRISAIAPKCPTLMDPHKDDPKSTNSAEESYKVLVDATGGDYYPYDCNIDMDKILRDYATDVIFRAYMHANGVVQLSKTPTDPNTIKVSIGGTPLSSDKWEYNSTRNEVKILWHLLDVTQFKAGDKIRIEYIAR